jgi:Cu/Ag efflux protein CusF
MHRDYDTSQRRPNIFLLNGRSFPFTLRDTPIDVRAGERVKLRVLNAGARTIALHTHGHHPIITALDGYPVPPAQRLARDVFSLLPAQRMDLELRPGNDGRHASGPGVWLMHDHSEQAVTNNGINPGGDLTAIVYDGFRAADGLPRVATSLKRFFDPDYYRGKIPVFDPAIFHAQATVAPPPPNPGAHGGAGEDSPYPTRREPAPARADETVAEHRIVATSCRSPRSFQRIHVKEGTRQAQAGEVYGFEPRLLHVERCQDVELVVENTDTVRHALMIPGLNPMFMLEFRGSGTESAHFVSPDRDITLPFHCHVATHEGVGMHGEIVVGRGGPPVSEPDTASRLHEGRGVVISVDSRKARLVVDHEEMPGFMAAMVMNYLVNPPSLLQGLRPGEKIRFTIDEDQRAIVRVAPLSR